MKPTAAHGAATRACVVASVRALARHVGGGRSVLHRGSPRCLGCLRRSRCDGRRRRGRLRSPLVGACRHERDQRTDCHRRCGSHDGAGSNARAGGVVEVGAIDGRKTGGTRRGEHTRAEARAAHRDVRANRDLSNAAAVHIIPAKSPVPSNPRKRPHRHLKSKRFSRGPTAAWADPRARNCRASSRPADGHAFISPRELYRSSTWPETSPRPTRCPRWPRRRTHWTRRLVRWRFTRRSRRPLLAPRRAPAHPLRRHGRAADHLVVAQAPPFEEAPRRAQRAGIH